MNDQIGRYLEACRDKVAIPIKFNPKEDTIKLYFAPLPDPDLEISMILGDCIHNNPFCS